MKTSINLGWLIRLTASWQYWHVVYLFDSHIVLFNKYIIDFWAFPTQRNRKKGIKRYFNWSFHSKP